MKKIQYNGSSKILNGIVTKVNLIIDKFLVDVKVNGTSVVVVNEEGEREADIDLSLADQNVKQSPTTDNKDYRVLLSKSDNDTEETDIARKNTDFKYNPSTGNLQATKLNGNTIPTDTDTLALNKDIPTQASDIGAIPATEKGANNGVATLGSDGKVPSSQIPGSVDEIIEGYYYNGSFYEDSAHTQLITPSSGKIYVDLDSNKTYRWGGSAYVEISESLALGETQGTAYEGSKGKTLADKLATIEQGAEVNVQADWEEADTSSDAYIQHKPTIPDELADLADDSTHRLVTDTEKSTWDDKADKTDVDKAELNIWNLLRQPYFHGSGTSSGTTRTVNADGSVTFTGTATASFYFNLKRYTQEWKLPKGTYRVSGCPSGGSSSTYFLRVAKYTTSSTTLVDEYGDGAEFTLTEESVMQISAAVINGYAIQGSLTFKPFIAPKEKVDEKVKQTQISSSDNNYPLLLAYSANGTEETQYTWKDTNLTLNPSMKQFTYDGAIRGNIFEFYLHGISVGSISYNSSNNSVVTLPASSGTLALQSDITSAINDLDVASTSIDQGETLATIKEENGKIAVTKQNIKIGLGQVDNFYRCGTQSAISGSNTWHKIASTTMTAINTDANIMLAVYDSYLPDTDSSETNCGILYCRARQGELGVMNYAELKFVANSGFDANRFRLYYTITTDTSITFEIWTSMSRRYGWRKYSLIGQSDRLSVYNNSWTIYNSTSPSAAPTESATCIRVDCEDNTYKQTDNDALGATNLIPYPYSSPSNYSNNYVTISADKKGTITATGVSPASGFGYQICSKADAIILDPTKSYIMSGLSNGSSSTIRFLLDLWTEDQNPAIDSYTTRLYQATTETTIPSGYKYLQITLYFYTGAGSKLPLTVSPMLRLATIADSTFKVYSASNRQLSIRKVDYTQIATYEMSDITSRAYQKNELMFFDGKLYRVTQAISNGGTIIRSGSGANITSTTLSAEIKAIRDALNI